MQFRFNHLLTRQLFPLTRLRPFGEMRLGIFTLQERLHHLASFFTTPSVAVEPETGIAISHAGLQQMYKGGLTEPEPEHFRPILHATDFVKHNDWALRADFAWIKANRQPASIPPSVVAINPEQIFIEPGARLQHCILNAENGPVYIAAGAEIMEGSCLRGPVAVGENAVVKMGARIYGATTIGPYCLAGGEIKNSILMGFSNKAHDGYLGDSVLGHWCNLGAGTSNSNLKNTAAEITVYNGVEPYVAGTKCGLLMGDFSRSAINTSFNTGTVVGVSCNVFCTGLTPRHIPDFTWGEPGETYRLEAALRDAANWMQLKGQTLSAETEAALRAAYAETINA